MTLEEAIIHTEEVADRCAVTDGNIKCEIEHRQLAEWLKELKERREKDDTAQLWIPCTPETMPLPNERCILLYSNGKISGGEYDYGNENFIVDFPDNDKAVHVAKWMPDPSEHEEGDTNEHHL